MTQKTAKTKDELCELLGVSASSLRRIEIRNKDNPPPQLNELGEYVVDEWAEWIEDCESGEEENGGDDELLELRKERERERILFDRERTRGARFRNDLAEGKYERKELFLEFAKKMVSRVRAYIDDLDEKAAILFGGEPEKLAQLRVIAADAEAEIEADFEREAVRSAEDGNGEE